MVVELQVFQLDLGHLLAGGVALMLQAQLRSQVEEVDSRGARVVDEGDPQWQLYLHSLGEDSGKTIFGII